MKRWATSFENLSSNRWDISFSKITRNLKHPVYSTRSFTRIYWPHSFRRPRQYLYRPTIATIMVAWLKVKDQWKWLLPCTFNKSSKQNAIMHKFYWNNAQRQRATSNNTRATCCDSNPTRNFNATSANSVCRERHGGENHNKKTVRSKSTMDFVRCYNSFDSPSGLPSGLTSGHWQPDVPERPLTASTTIRVVEHEPSKRDQRATTPSGSHR